MITDRHCRLVNEKSKGAGAPACLLSKGRGPRRWGDEGGPLAPNSLRRGCCRGHFGSLCHFPRSTQTCIYFFLPSSHPPSLPFKQNLLLYSKTGLFISFKTASSSVGPGLGENTKCGVTDLRPAKESLTPKLISSRIPTSGSGKVNRRSEVQLHFTEQKV